MEKISKFFPLLGIYSGKGDSVVLLGYECTINSQDLIKIVGAIFEKIEIFNFCVCELVFILWVGGKIKKVMEIFARGH